MRRAEPPRLLPSPWREKRGGDPLGCWPEGRSPGRILATCAAGSPHRREVVRQLEGLLLPGAWI